MADLGSPDGQPSFGHEAHLRAAVDWLCRAQDLRQGKADSGGVSAGWSFEDGWLPSYPETSGYIVETFIAAARVLGDATLVNRAHAIIDWELGIQNSNGSFPGHFGESGSQPVIFNTGQILHGLLAGYLEMDRDECLEAAIRAGRWMVASQDEDGCWRRNVHNGVPHTYNTRAAWGLLRTGMLADEPELEQAARRNLDWAMTQQTEAGWFRSNAFVADEPPFTHTIAYAIRGLLEGGLLAREVRYVEAAARAARAVARVQRQEGWLAGTYADDWAPRASYCCLTGVAQMTLIWERMLQEGLGEGLGTNVERSLGYLKRHQRINGGGRPEDGGIAGSAPLWGRYSMFEYPNWAAKFFADALMMDLDQASIPTTSTARDRCAGNSEAAAISGT